MDEIDKQLFQYRSNLERDKERPEKLCKVEQGMGAREGT